MQEIVKIQFKEYIHFFKLNWQLLRKNCSHSLSVLVQSTNRTLMVITMYQNGKDVQDYNVHEVTQHSSFESFFPTSFCNSDTMEYSRRLYQLWNDICPSNGYINLEAKTGLGIRLSYYTVKALSDYFQAKRKCNFSR